MRSWAGFGLAASALLAGCGDDSIATCVPGQSDTCAGAGGCEGVQVCGASGSFGECVCNDPADSGPSPVDGSADGSVAMDAAADAGPGVCGDGVEGPGEACDDANTNVCDGCVSCGARFSLTHAAAGSRFQVDAPEVAGVSDAFTVELWVKLSPGPGSPAAVEVSTRTASGGWQLRAAPTGIYVASHAASVSFPMDLLDDAWHHVAWVWDTSRNVREVLVDGRTIGQTHFPALVPGGPLVAGGLYEASGVEDRPGQMDELRISRLVRYQHAFTPERRFEADLDTIALYHFDEGGGTVAEDATVFERDGTYSGTVSWSPDEAYGVCEPVATDPVQDVSSNPIELSMLGGELTIRGLSSVGWYFDLIETPVGDGRTHREPGAIHYRDVTMRGVRGSTADVTALADWVASPRRNNATLRFDEPGVVGTSLELVGLDPISSSGRPVDAGGGELEITELVVSVRGLRGFTTDFGSWGGRPCPAPQVGIEIESITSVGLEASALVASPLPLSSDPVVLAGFAGCPDVASVRDTRAALIAWFDTFRDDPTQRGRRAMSIIWQTGTTLATEVFRNNIFDLFPAGMDYFDATRPHGTTFLITVHIASGRVERG
jgi:hypothetical protein